MSRDQIAGTADAAAASEPKVIKPSIGRKVWFWPASFGEWPQGMTVVPRGEDDQDGPQPLDATIVYVHNDRLVNLLVVDHAGVMFPIQNVQLVQPGDQACATGHRAEWMPYQVGQAKKAGGA